MFQFGMDKRVIYVIMAVLVIISLRGYLTNTAELLNLLLTIPAVLIAITFHEFAHAFAADKLGDNTPRSQGRLTLNPFAHIDIVGFALLIAAGFGWGKPVQINPVKFKRNISMTQGEAIVSVAGPLMNFILAFVFTILYFCVFKFEWYANMSIQAFTLIMQFLTALISINVGLGVFNLIPLPPLDGEKIFRNILPYNAIQWLDRNSGTLQIIFMVLWITGLLGYVVSPIVQFLFKWLFVGVGMILGL